MDNKPKRGCILSGMLWLGLIGSFLGMFTILTQSYLAKSLPAGTAAMSFPAQILSTIISIVCFVSIIGILRWKKIFVYPYVAASLISFVSAFITNKFSIPMAIGAVIGVIINLWVAYAVMKLFKKMEEEGQEV